jgi:hypothetical protein
MKLIYLTVSLFLITTSIVSAQSRSTSEGFFLNLHFNASSWTLDEFEVDAEGGGGGGLELGYGITPLIALFAEVDGAVINAEEGGTYTLSHADLGVQFNFGNSNSALRPFAEAAFAARVAEFDFSGGEFGDEATVQVSGPGLTLGGGLKYHFSTSFALDLGLKVTLGDINEVKIGTLSQELEGMSATSARLNLGFTWFP